MPERRGPSLLLLIALAVVLWLAGDVRRGLWEPDEARYAYVAREMREGGTWFVPHLHGEPYPDKPPLMFWLINAASVVTGGHINGLAARLPSLLGALLALWATARLLERWRDGDAARRAVAVLFTAYLFWWEGAWGQIDALLCGLEMMSLWCFFTASDPGRGRRFLLAYVFAGLAVFAKGPVGLAIPVGVYLSVTLAAGEGRLLRRWHWAWGPPLAAAIPGLWLLVAWQQGAPPDYFAAMFGAKSFGRVIQDHHAQPLYYYLTTFPADFLPWTIFLPATYRALGPGLVRRRVLAWGLFVLILFSLFVGKRNLYVLGAFPAAAMLIAAGWDGLGSLARPWRAITGWLAMGLVAVLALAEGAAPFVKDLPVPRGTTVPGALLLTAGCLGLVAIYRRESLSRRWLATFAATFFLHQITVSALVLPAINPLKAPIAFAAEARERLPADSPIYLYRDQLAIVPLYADRPGRQLHEPGEVAALLERATYTVIVFDAEDWAELAPRFGDRVRARDLKVGGKRLVWVDFPPPTAP